MHRGVEEIQRWLMGSAENRYIWTGHYGIAGRARDISTIGYTYWLLSGVACLDAAFAAIVACNFVFCRCHI